MDEIEFDQARLYLERHIKKVLTIEYLKDSVFHQKAKKMESLSEFKYCIWYR